MAKNWYVVHALSQHENKVRDALAEHVARNEAEDAFGDILVPTEEVVEVKNGKRRTTERKFFPGYVLVQMDMTDDTWHLVNSVPGVLGFIGGTADRPAPISDREAEQILNRVEESVEKPRPKTVFEPGQEVRVVDGPFSEFNGVVEEVNYDKNRLRVAVTIFGRSTPVDLSFDQVEKG